MSWSPRNSRRGRRRLLAVSAAAALLLFADALLGGALRHGAREAGSLVWRAGSAFGGAIGQSGFFSTRARLARENATLAQEVGQLQEGGAAYRAVAEENDALRALVHAAKAAPGVTAPITSSVEASPYGTFEIGAGRDDGIKESSLVESGTGFVAGVVQDVAAHHSLVREVFAPGSSVETAVKGTPLTLEGQGGGSAKGRVPRGVEVGLGDSVVSPSFGGRPVGVVGKVEQDAAGASEIYVRFPVNLSAVRFVYIVEPR